MMSFYTGLCGSHEGTNKIILTQISLCKQSNNYYILQRLCKGGAEIQAKMYRGCRFLLFWHHSYKVTLNSIPLGCIRKINWFNTLSRYGVFWHTIPTINQFSDAVHRKGSVMLCTEKVLSWSWSCASLKAAFQIVSFSKWVVTLECNICSVRCHGLNLSDDTTINLTRFRLLLYAKHSCPCLCHSGFKQCCLHQIQHVILFWTLCTQF